MPGMKKASAFFSAAERATIEAAVAEAEDRTAGEIVPVIATASGRYDRGEDLFGLVVAVAALALAWWGFQDLRLSEGEWAAGPTLALGLLPVLLVVVVGFLLGAVAATFVPALRLPFVSQREMREEVERSAAASFQRLRVRRTVGGTGVLIYVSLYERMVQVLGDHAIAKKLSQSDWDEVCALAVDGLKHGRGAEGLAAAVRRCGELLATHFPRPPGDRNEIPDTLRFVD